LKVRLILVHEMLTGAFN